MKQNWATLLGMVVLLTAAIMVYWSEYSNTERIIFPGLFALGVYMLYRAQSARHLLKSQPADWQHAYIEHVGFGVLFLDDTKSKAQSYTEEAQVLWHQTLSNNRLFKNSIN